ncbi:MAG: class I adenylate-forming enzyme family protein [Sulfurifustaceae bacterium]
MHTETPAQIPALSAITEELLQRFIDIPGLVHAFATRYPQRPALILDERTVDYAAIDAMMDRVAATLQRDGLRAGDAVAICAGTSIEYAAVFLGALRAGCVVAPLAPNATAANLESMIADAGAKRLFLDAAAAATLASVAARITAKRVALDDSDAGTRFSAWLAPTGTKPAAVAIQPEWPFNIIYSSGTTGTPKGIVQSHRMRWRHVVRGVRTGYDVNAVTLISTPLYSNTTLVSFFPTLALGGTVVLMAKFDVAGYLALAQKHRVTHTMLVPVQYQRIMAFADFGRYDLSSFRMKFSTSAPFSAALKADILKRWPGGLVEVYGLTEGGVACVLEAHNFPNKLHTVGQPATAHDIRLIDEQGREVPRGEVGEVVGHSEAMMTGYHNQPGLTKDMEWYDATGTRFIRSGDVGRFDEDGFLVLMDRKKDMIISGGFNIYPSDLETVARTHPEVAEVAVVGVPSERWGETPVAFIVRQPGAKATAEELLAWVNERVGKTQRLAAVELTSSLPRSAIGKVLKRELRDDFRKKKPALP